MAYEPHDVIEAIPVVEAEDEHIIFFNVAKGEFEFLPAGTRMVFDTETGKLFTLASGNKNIHLDNDVKLLHEIGSFTQTDKLEQLDKNMKLKEYVDIHDSNGEIHVQNTRTAELEKPEEDIKIPVAIYDSDKEILSEPNTRKDELEKPDENIKECGVINAKDEEIFQKTCQRKREKSVAYFLSHERRESVLINRFIWAWQKMDFILSEPMTELHHIQGNEGIASSTLSKYHIIFGKYRA